MEIKKRGWFKLYGQLEWQRRAETLGEEQDREWKRPNKGQGPCKWKERLLCNVLTLLRLQSAHLCCVQYKNYAKYSSWILAPESGNPLLCCTDFMLYLLNFIWLVAWNSFLLLLLLLFINTRFIHNWLMLYS